MTIEEIKKEYANFRNTIAPKYPCCSCCKNLRTKSDPDHWHPMDQCDLYPEIQFGYSDGKEYAGAESNRLCDDYEVILEEIKPDEQKA